MTHRREQSVRQLPPGKLNNIRQLFEDGEGESSMENKPVPPARPQQPPSRSKSPATKTPAIPKIPPRLYSRDEVVSGSGASTQDTNNRFSSCAKDENNSSLQQPVIAESRGRVSPTVNRRIVSLIGSASTSPSPLASNSHSNTNSDINLRRQSSGEGNNHSSSPAVSIAKRISDLTGGGEREKLGNDCSSSAGNRNSGGSGDGNSNKGVSGSSVTADFYSKINKKNNKNGEANMNMKDQPNKSIINDGQMTPGANSPLIRREAVRKTQDDRRNTIACFQSEDDSDDASSSSPGVSVLSRTKLFDQQQPKPGNKPPPPRKPEAVKRQFSLRAASKESSPPLVAENKPSNFNTPQEKEKVKDGQDDLYETPWDEKKGSNVERLKKMAMRDSNLPGNAAKTTTSESSSSVTTAAKNPVKPPHTGMKPSLPSTPPPRLSHPTPKNRDVSSSSSSPRKIPLSARTSEPTSKPPSEPPPKPPLEPPPKPPSEPPPKPPSEPPPKPPKETSSSSSASSSQKPWFGNKAVESPSSSSSKPTGDSSSSKPKNFGGGAPPKPPRTHAHDAYLKSKILSSEADQQNINDDPPYASRKKLGQISVSDSSSSNSNSKQAEEKENNAANVLSVQERISKMNIMEKNSSNESDDSNSNSNVMLRHQPPNRPPPPKRRPNSSGSNLSSGEGPAVIPLIPKSRLSRQRSVQPPSPQNEQPRNPMDELPATPGAGADNGDRPLKRFPLRKSLSSECVYNKNSRSQENGEDDDEMSSSQMTKSSYESAYEAVIDPDGYAVPNEFMKLAVRKMNSDTFYGDGECPGRFLTRLEGFGPDKGNDPSWSPHNCKAGGGGGGGGPRFNPRQDASPGFGSNTARRDQCIDKVAKKKMMIVKHKINQAYADLDIVFQSPSAQTANEDAEEENDQVPELKEIVVDQTVLRKRIEHCSSIRRMSRMSMKKSKEYLSAIYPQLFEYCLVVGLKALTNNPGYEPYIIHKFPENRNYKMGAGGEIYMATAEVSSNLSVTSFCFPDAAIFKPGSMASLSESYSFVMTYADGSRVYGYCRRIQLTDVSLPEVICIISPIDAFNMYNTLLNEIEARRRTSFDLASEVIAASFGRPLPKPGKVCHIRTLDQNGEMETIFLNRPSDNRLADVNYESPLCSLGTDKLVKVFSAMLMERRIILCSSNLSLLTETVHALCALLYPFQWQHVYIPILPTEMLDVVCAPMPYIVGILSAYLPQVFQMELEEVFVVDLDKKSIIRNLGDEATLIPRKIQRALKTAINMCKIDNEARNAQWLMVAEAFLRMFIELIGHFGNHVCSQQDGNRIFQKEGFIVEIVSKEIRQFLEWFTETQMFEVFISNHVEKSDWGSCDLFMQRLQDYKDSKEESRRHKGLGAKVKNFGKAIKTKLAEAMD